MTHPHSKRNVVPSAVLTKSGTLPTNAAKQSSPRVAVSVNTVSTAAPKTTVNVSKPRPYVLHKSHSPVRRPFSQRTTPTNSYFKETLNIVKVNNGTTAGPKAVVSAVKGNEIELEDKGIIYSGCSSHMTGNKSYLSDYEDFDGGFVAFGGDYRGGKITGKVLSPDFKLIDENQVLLRVPRKNNIYIIDLKNIVPSKGLT
ncbi:hypothetical protein Tco_1195873 [Tanacetum coccineum]